MTNPDSARLDPRNPDQTDVTDKKCKSETRMVGGLATPFHFRKNGEKPIADGDGYWYWYWYRFRHPRPYIGEEICQMLNCSFIQQKTKKKMNARGGELNEFTLKQQQQKKYTPYSILIAFMCHKFLNQHCLFNAIHHLTNHQQLHNHSPSLLWLH